VFSIVDVLAGGAVDSDLFFIDASTGELTIRADPANPIAFDFENPLDADGNNIYNITLSVTDGVSTSTQIQNFTVLDLALMTASQFENNTNQTPPTFNSFISQEAFVKAMTDGTLTWSPSLSGVTFTSGNQAVTINTIDFVYRTLGQTIDFDMTGTFTGVAIGDATQFASGTFNVDIINRAALEFAAGPAGEFRFSNVADPAGGVLTIQSGETLSLTAAQVSAASDMSNPTAPGIADITNQGAVFTAGVKIGEAGNGNFAAAATVNLIGTDGVDVSGVVGIGQPTVTP
jgi:hypothetical protein